MVLGFLLSCSQREPIKIGFVAGLSGRSSQLGVSARNGVQLAVDNINGSGGINGRKIELIVRDDKSDPETVKKVFNELIEEGVIAIIGPLLSKMAVSSLATIHGKDVLTISPTVSADMLKNRDDNFIRVVPVASYQGKTIAENFLRKGYRTVAVVYDSSNRAYTEPIYLMFKELFENAENEIIYTKTFEGRKKVKFFDIAREIVASKPEALFIITSGTDAACLCQQIRKFDSKIRFYGTFWVKAENIIQDGGRSVEGMTVVVPYENEQKSEEYLKFQKQYKERHKTSPGFASLYAYEAALVLTEGIKNSKSLRPESIKEYIIKTSKFRGLEEEFTIDEFGDAVRSNILVTIRDGKFVRVVE